MPYNMFQSGNGWQVWKVDEDGKRVEKKGPRYPSKSRAKKYMSALWAAEETETKKENMGDAMSDLGEVTKKVGSANYPASDFLVVSDPEMPSTWHLQVKKNGKPDRGLAGAAWAALFSAGGFRGNKYSGPDAGAAKSKLRALYTAQKWPMPDEKAKEADVEEMYSGYEAMPMNDVPWGAMSFEDIDAADVAHELMERLEKRTSQFYTLFWRIWNNMDIPVDAKVTAWQDLFTEFTQVFQSEIDTEDTEMEALESFSESATGSIIRISESDKQNGEARQPVKMDIVVIEPGFGNPKDKHYYPADVLRRDAGKVFEGAKMYATDHRPEEKSVRTEVGKIERVIRFSETGAPVARVKIWDADFAEDIRNRNELNELGTLEVSILAKGKAKKGTIEGKECNIVEAIIPSKYTNVDFVTSAGAGGRALQLVENDEEVTMPDELESVAEDQEATAAEVQESQDVTLHEHEQEQVEEPTETQEPVQEANQEEPTYLAESAVNEILGNSNLPNVSIDRLVKIPYLSEAELKSAIQAEKDYIKTLIKSGEPSGLGETAPHKETLTPEELVEDHNRRIDAILKS